MGFGSETITTVGSSAYNLAGEPKNRGNFLKNNLISSVMSGQANRDGLGNSIFTAHRYGPRTDLITYAKWADYSGYAEQVGFPKGFTYRGSRIDADSFAMLKNPEPGKESEFLYGYTDSANYQYLAYWYIGEYAPQRIGQAFTIRPETTVTGSLSNRKTVLTGKLILKFTGTGEEIIFTPPVSIKTPSAVYAYHFYHTRDVKPAETFDSGWINVINEAGFPSVDGFTLDGSSSSSAVNGFVLNKSVTTNISYSNSTPPTETTSTTTTTPEGEDYLKVYKKTEIFPSASGSLGSYERNWEVFHKCVWQKITLPAVVQTSVGEISPGVFKTTTVTTVEDLLIATYDYKNTWSQVLAENWGNERVLIYRKGDSSTVDAYIFGDVGRDTGLYLPIIPLRLHNRAVNKNNYPAQYALNRKAARKAFKKAKSIDTLLKNLESNDQVDQIDHAWVVFGSSLGSKEQDALNYNYQFMKDWVEGTPYDPLSIKDPFAYAAALEGYWEALEAHKNYSSESDGGAAKRPPKPIPPKAATYTFQTYQVKGRRSKKIIETQWAYNIRIVAKGGALRTGKGYHARSKNKTGTCWVYQQGNVSIKSRVLVDNGGDGGAYWKYENTTIPVIVFGKQLTPSAWEEYVFFDVNHTNYVYEGLSVVTSATKALQEGENSSFLFPMSHQVLKNMQLIEGTQLAMASSYLVINYYDKQKIPWYASGFFQIVIVVIVVVIAVSTGYVSGESLGVLGTNAAVGAAIGFTAGTTAAILAGAIVNALAAAIITAVISKLSTALLGDKIGSIVGAVLSMVVVWGMTNNWNFNASDLAHSFTKADNLLKLTLSGTDMAAQYMQASAQQIIADTQSLLEDYKDKATELAAMTQQYLGSNGIDPTVIAEATRNLVESPEEFMSRTLRTGDDIADISLSLVERFPEPQMKLPYT